MDIEAIERAADNADIQPWYTFEQLVAKGIPPRDAHFIVTIHPKTVKKLVRVAKK